MRTLLFLTIATIVALTAYFYGPDIEAESPMPTTDWIPTLGADDEDAVSAGLEYLKQEAPAPKVVAPAEKAKPAAPKQVLRRKTGAVKPKRALPKAPSWQANEKKKETIAEIRGDDEQEEERNFSDPMKNRWVEELSGRKVNVSFSKTRTNTNCGAGTVDCDAIRNSRDAKVVGVIMKTNRLWNQPTQAVDGDWERGHYDKGTPAVYVK